MGDVLELPATETRATGEAPPSSYLTSKMRDPLPAGHPATWGAITRGTVLEGMPCRRPPYFRRFRD